MARGAVLSTRRVGALFSSVFACGALAGEPPIGSGQLGMAGCGLGSIFFGNRPGAAQIMAATTNASTGSQTFGITSGTSNCGSGLFADDRTRQFVSANREALAKDAARGSGDTVLVLAKLAGCADAAAVGAALQRNWGAVFSASGDDLDAVIADRIIVVLRSDALTHCTPPWVGAQ